MREVRAYENWNDMNSIAISDNSCVSVSDSKTKTRRSRSAPTTTTSNVTLAPGMNESGVSNASNKMFRRELLEDVDGQKAKNI